MKVRSLSPHPPMLMESQMTICKNTAGASQQNSFAESSETPEADGSYSSSDMIQVSGSPGIPNMHTSKSEKEEGHCGGSLCVM